MGILNDIICQVYAGNKSQEIIYSVLTEFLPDYEKLNLDYTSKPDEPNYIFKSEEELISFFVDHKGLSQTFYWNQKNSNPDNIMIGADVTEDDKLIISLTLDGTESLADSYLTRLMNHLDSDIGIITYGRPAEYQDGKDFLLKYAQI